MQHAEKEMANIGPVFEPRNYTETLYNNVAAMMPLFLCRIKCGNIISLYGRITAGRGWNMEALHVRLSKLLDFNVRCKGHLSPLLSSAVLLSAPVRWVYGKKIGGVFWAPPSHFWSIQLLLQPDRSIWDDVLGLRLGLWKHFNWLPPGTLLQKIIRGPVELVSYSTKKS